VLRDCRIESVSQPPTPRVQTYRCGGLRIVIEGIEAKTADDADEHLASMQRTEKNKGGRTSFVDGTMAGGHLRALYVEVGPEDRSLYAGLVAMPKAGPGFVRVTCWTNGRSSVREHCWELLAAMNDKTFDPPTRDAREKWTIRVAERPVALTDDCYWMGEQNVFCTHGQLSWDFTSERPRAVSFTDWNIERARTKAEKTGGSGDVKDGVPCRALGQATRCVHARTEWKHVEPPQIVDAIYAVVPVGPHALALVCSVDRATVPEGIGPLCAQVIELEGAGKAGPSSR
jgi:hypothetical protein